MKRTFLGFAFCAAFFTGFLGPSPIPLTKSRHAGVPANRLWIPRNSRFPMNMNEADFNSVLQKIFVRHEKYFTAVGATLRIDTDWIDGTANAFADREGNTFTIEVPGGLARHPLLTRDAFTLLVCHEMGHHLGGAPTGKNLGWPSFEGQSDYFSTLKCLRRIFADENNESMLRRQILDPVLVERCKTAFPDRLNQLICVRSGLAGLSTANFLYSIDKRGGVPALDRRDTSQVPKTQYGHASPQCRLDTYVAGAVCRADSAKNPDPHRHDLGVCTEQNDAPGARPRCWYNPAGVRGSRF